jgi:Flp pilus assembly pilin Flp
MNILSSVMRAVARWRFDDGDVEGQAMVEYSLIFVLIIIVTFSIVTTMSSTINENFFQVVQSMP